MIKSNILQTNSILILLIASLFTMSCDQEVDDLEMFRCTENSQYTIENLNRNTVSDALCGTASIVLHETHNGGYEEMEFKIDNNIRGTQKIYYRQPDTIEIGEYIYVDNADPNTLDYLTFEGNLTNSEVSKGNINVTKMDRDNKLISFTYMIFGNSRTGGIFTEINGKVTDLYFGE